MEHIVVIVIEPWNMYILWSFYIMYQYIVKILNI